MLEVKFDPQLLHRAHQFLAHGTVHGGDDAVGVFDDVHLRAQPAIDRTELQSNDPATDDDHGLGQFGETQCLCAGDDAFLVHFEERQGAGLGPCGDDHMLRPNVEGISFLRGHGDGVGIHEGPHAMVDVDVVLFHQELDAFCGLRNHLSLPGNHLRKVDAQLAHLDAMRGELLFGLMVVFGAVQKCLGGDAAHVQAGASQGGIFLHQSGTQSQL